MSNGKNGDKKKSGWDIVDIFAKPLGGLLTALAIAWIGHSMNDSLAERQMVDSNYRLYTQLMSQREEAESNLRKDMFQSIIASFLGSDTASIESKVLNLELLTQNFHESLNIKPLFMHLKRSIKIDTASTETEKADFMDRLYSVARDITRKQRVILRTHGKKVDHEVVWQPSIDSILDTGMTKTLVLDSIEREFNLKVMDINTAEKEVEVELYITSIDLRNDSIVPASAPRNFGVGYFDFPMIDNIRLSKDHRCAVVLSNFEDSIAQLTVLLFPGEYASMKEKRYYQDLVKDLEAHVSSVEESE